MLKKIWTELVTSILNSQKAYYNYTAERRDWLISNLVDLFLSDDFSPESSYRCLVLLDRNYKYGRYALLFNQAIFNCESKDGLREICQAAEYPELEALSDLEQKQWDKEIKTNMLAYNLYTDAKFICYNSNIDKESCHNEAVSFMRKSGNYLDSQSEHVVFLSEIKDRLVITPIREIDLLFSLINNLDLPIPIELRDVLISKNREIILICKKAIKLGYKHTYKD
jgi:hypothetical protein